MNLKKCLMSSPCSLTSLFGVRVWMYFFVMTSKRLQDSEASFAEFTLMPFRTMHSLHMYLQTCLCQFFVADFTFPCFFRMPQVVGISMGYHCRSWIKGFVAPFAVPCFVVVNTFHVILQKHLIIGRASEASETTLLWRNFDTCYFSSTRGKIWYTRGENQPKVMQ